MLMSFCHSAHYICSSLGLMYNARSNIKRSFGCQSSLLGPSTSQLNLQVYYLQTRANPISCLKASYEIT